MRTATRHQLLARAAVLVLAAGLLGPSPSPWMPREAAAQASNRTRLEIGLHTGVLGVRTIYPERPRVRVLDARGVELLDIEATGARPEDGRWSVELDLGAAGQPPLLLRPGHRVEVTVGGRVTAAEVPALRATAAEESQKVTGRAPAGVPAVALLLHRDESLYPDLEEPELAVAPVAPDGTFAFQVDERFPLRPGTWGEVAYESEDGHLFHVPFAPPWAQVAPEQYLVVIRADGGLDPAFALRDEGGFESHRSYRTIELGGGLYYTQLSNDGTAAGIFIPEPGDRVALDLGDGREVGEPVPDVRASVLRSPAELRGHAPPGSRLRLRLRPGGDGQERAGSAVADAEGRFAIALEGIALGRDAEATVGAWPGGAFDWVTVARVPFVEAPLQGHIVRARLEGRGRVRVEHRPADGPVTATIVETAPDGSLQATLQSAGVQARIAPGDELAFLPERGESVLRQVPEVSVFVDAAERRLSGQAPPGAELEARFFLEEASIFGRELYERPSRVLRGEADEAGRFALRCEQADCRAGYGTLTAYLGEDRYLSYWVERPVFGLAVSYAEVLGKATAGTEMTFTPHRPDGEALSPRVGVARPELLTGALPGWFLDLGADFPEGLPEGARIEVSEGGEPREDIVVPPFDWKADVRRNRLAGAGPPLRTIFAVGLAPPGETGRALSGVAQGVIGADGRYDIAFAGFDLRPGDDLEIYVLLDEDRYLRWNEAGVEGVEPTPRPSATPRPLPRPSATPRDEPTAAPLSRRVYLPRLSR